MTVKECYELMNGDYEDALERLQMDKLVERFMLKFPNEGTMNALREAVAKGDIKASFSAAHTLKGVAANLGMKSLMEAAHNLTEQLRPCTAEADPALMDILEKRYVQTIEAIEKYQAQQ